MTKYNAEIEAKMLEHFLSLSEKNQRHYAAVEALKLDYGGRRYICNLFNMSEYRLRCGIAELNNPELMSQIPEDKQRRPGGGRKKTLSKKTLGTTS